MKATARKIKDNEWIAEVKPVGDNTWVDREGITRFYKSQQYPIVSPSDKEWLEKNNMDRKEVEGHVKVLANDFTLDQKLPPGKPNYERLEEMLDRSGSQPGKAASKIELEEAAEGFLSYIDSNLLCDNQNPERLRLVKAIYSDDAAFCSPDSQGEKDPVWIPISEKQKHPLFDSHPVTDEDYPSGFKEVKKIHRCGSCETPIAKGNDFCGECLCEDDSE